MANRDLTISIFFTLIGNDMVSSAYREINLITSEYISEPKKYRFK